MNAERSFGGGPKRLIRYTVAAVFVALWMGMGWAFDLGPDAYLILGIPLTIAFQKLVARRQLREAWIAGGPPVSRRNVNIPIAGVVALTPLWMLYSAAQGRQAVAVAYLTASLVGAVGVGYAFKQAGRGTWQSLLRCLASAGVIGILWIVASHLQGGSGELVSTSTGLNRWTTGLRSFLTYVPAVFVIEEVTFRGVLDRHVNGLRRRSLGSAVFVSALWGLWHLPLVPASLERVIGLLLVHVPVGIFLSLEQRRSGNLVVPGVTHAFINSVRNALA